MTAPPSTRAAPAERCDLVMKGGIASGIVYPLAVVELAERYRFASIGGTSAGAIAAAGTAAAEHGRQRGGAGDAPFARLARLPAELGDQRDGRSLLRRLFQPQASVAGVFAPVAAAIDEDPKRRGPAFGRALVGRFWPWAAAGALPGALLLAEAVDAAAGDRPALRRGAHAGAAGLLGAGAVLAGAPLGALAGWLRAAAREVPANGFGVCAGHDRAAADAEDPQLTDWLHGLLQELAGDTGHAGPLTFGDLEAAGVRLRMVTTNLTMGRPEDLPFDADGPAAPAAPAPWWFSPAAMARLFPDEVVAAMVAAAPEAERDGPLVPFPDAAHLPVVVATRMSLSFPLLLSAVPLHPWDPEAGAPAAQPAWFSDGGICSNFPIHFFDAPAPRWPTFGINLRPLAPGEDVVVWRPEERPGQDRRNDAATPWFTFSRARRDAGSLRGFAGALKDTAQNWHDSVQLDLPGFRDRVVHVGLTTEEGGLNLSMPPEVITRVAQRGGEAGRLLARGYQDEAYWDTHRWVRYRAFLAAAEELLARFDRGYRSLDDGGAPLPGTEPYDALVSRAPGSAPVTAYDWPPERAAELVARAAMLVRLAQEWARSSELGEGRPEPPAQLRLVPRL